MTVKTLGKTDLNFSSIIMGTWQAGKSSWVGIDDDDIKKAIVLAYEKGVNTFDTAEEYGDGYSEKVLGETLKPMRQNVYYATKVFSHHLRYEQVKKSCEQSLKNLKTDVIDLYQIHWPAGSFGSEVVPLEETLGAMNDLKKEGKIRAIGVSNFSYEDLVEATKHSEISSLQSPYSLFWRHLEKDLIPFCEENHISILAYSPLAQGLLTGKFTANLKLEKGDNRLSNKLFLPPIFQKCLEAVEKMRPLADQEKISLAGLALSWITSKKSQFAIVGARNASQMEENAKALNINLGTQLLNELDQLTDNLTEEKNSHACMWTWTV